MVPLSTNLAARSVFPFPVALTVSQLPSLSLLSTFARSTEQATVDGGGGGWRAALSLPPSPITVQRSVQHKREGGPTLPRPWRLQGTMCNHTRL